MQSEAQEIAQSAAMTAKDWWPIVVGATSALLAALGAVVLTLLWQGRKEKRDAKLRLFITLMMHRKSNPPTLDSVNAMNLIDVVFFDEPAVLAKWHTLYNILGNLSQLPAEQFQHAHLELLSEIAGVLGYKKLQQIDIDKFYVPQAHVNQAVFNQEFQSMLFAFFTRASEYIGQQHPPNPSAPVAVTKEFFPPERPR